MDPNENLKQQLALARKIIEMADSIKDPSELEGDELRRYDEERALIEQDLGQEAQALAELVLALDEWLCNDGFRPGRWIPVRS